MVILQEKKFQTSVYNEKVRLARILDKGDEDAWYEGMEKLEHK